MELELIVSLMIELLASSLNAANTLNDTQVDECTLLIIEKYWMLRPEEILLVFKKAKLGEYGTDYNRLDIMTICKWLNRYIDEERTPFFERQNQQLKPDLISQSEFDEKYNQLRDERTNSPEIYKQELKAEQLRKMLEKREKYVESEKEADFQEFQKTYYENRNKRVEQVPKKVVAG